MSKERQTARAARAAAAAARAEAERAEREKVAAERRRSERRSLWWRRIRLWQHGPAFHRRRETWGALATVILLVLLVVYLMTRSWGLVIGTALILLVGSPVLVRLFFDRSRR